MADHATDTPVSVTITRTIPAPTEKVFAAWTTPEALKRWSAPGDLTNPIVEVDLRVGGRYRIDMAAPNGAVHRVTGVYKVIDPPRRLVYTWFWETNPALGEMLVTVEFRARGTVTDVVLEHSRLTSRQSADNHEKGWAGCFAKLERLWE